MENEQLCSDDIVEILTSLRYSKRAVADGNAPYILKKQKLETLEALEAKVRSLKVVD